MSSFCKNFCNCFVHNFTAHVLESACAALHPEKPVGRKHLVQCFKGLLPIKQEGVFFILLKKVLLKLGDQRIWPSSTVLRVS